MAGPDPADFSAADFRAGIHFAMKMGQPAEAGTEAIFVLAPDVIGSGTDAQGVPWEPSLVGTEPNPGEEVPALCAIQYSDVGDAFTPGIDSTPGRILVTLLDAEWELVKECIGLRIGGEWYQRDKTPPPMGLFSVGVHQIYFLAGDV